MLFNNRKNKQLNSEIDAVLQQFKAEMPEEFKTSQLKIWSDLLTDYKKSCWTHLGIATLFTLGLALWNKEFPSLTLSLFIIGMWVVPQASVVWGLQRAIKKLEANEDVELEIELGLRRKRSD
jgi:hypothetical protein